MTADESRWYGIRLPPFSPNCWQGFRPRSWASLLPSLLNLTFSFYPAFPSHIPASGLLPGPASGQSHFWCLPPKSQLVTNVKCPLWGSCGTSGNSVVAHDTQKRHHELQILTRVILLCFNHARVNYVFYSCNGYGGFSDVGWNDHFAIALKEENQKAVWHTYDSEVLKHIPHH